MALLPTDNRLKVQKTIEDDFIILGWMMSIQAPK